MRGRRPGGHIRAVEVTVRPGVDVPMDEAEVEAVLEAALDAAGAPAGSSVSIILADDTELARLNEAHMGKMGPTDVLAFPLLPANAFPAHAGQGSADAGLDPTVRVGPAAPAFVLPPGERLHLGDIVVSVERAAAQAQEGRGGQAGDRHWSPRDELRLLITHGALHLCGWDHAEPEEESAMRALESRLLGR